MLHHATGRAERRKLPTYKADGTDATQRQPEAQETANEPILISEWVWVCLACTYIWSHVEFPDPADAASSGHAGPGHPLVNVCPIMPNLHDPWPVPNPSLSVQSTPQSFRSLVSQAHSLLGRNPTRLLPSKQGRRTCRTSKLCRQPKLTHADSLTHSLIGYRYEYLL